MAMFMAWLLWSEVGNGRARRRVTRRPRGRAVASCDRPRLIGHAMEATPVLGGAHADRAQERPAHRLGRPESAAARHGSDGLAGVLQQPARGLQADALHVASGREAGLVAKR